MNNHEKGREEIEEELFKKFAPCVVVKPLGGSTLYYADAIELRRTQAMITAQLTIQENSKHFIRRWRFKSFIWKLKEAAKKIFKIRS